MFTLDNKYSSYNQMINFKSLFDKAIMLVECTMNKKVGGFNEVWYIYRSMENKNVRLHDYESDFIDESPKYQDCECIDVLFRETEDKDRFWQPLVSYESYMT